MLPEHPCECWPPPPHVGVGFLFQMNECVNCSRERLLYFQEDGSAVFGDGTPAPIVVRK